MIDKNNKSPKIDEFFKKGATLFEVDNDFKETLRNQLNNAYLNRQTSEPSKTDKLISHLLHNKNHLLFGLALFTIVLSGITWRYYNLNVSGDLNSIANIKHIEGDVEFLAENNEWEILKLDSKIEEGDSIKVIGNGKAVLKFENGTEIRLDSDSIIKIKEINNDGIIIKNETGSVYARNEDVNKRVVVEVEDTTFTAYQTAYLVSNTDIEKDVEVYRNNVVAISTDEKEVHIEEGEEYNLYSKEESVEKMDSEEIASDDFVIWNRERDLSDDEYKDNLGILKTITPNITAFDEAILPDIDLDTSEDSIAIAKLTLNAEIKNGNLNLKWTTKNLNISEGYIINLNIVQRNILVRNSSVLSKSFDLDTLFKNEYANSIDDTEIIVYICQNDGEDKCYTKSNTVKLEIPDEYIEIDDDIVTPTPTATNPSSGFSLY